MGDDGTRQGAGVACRRQARLLEEVRGQIVLKIPKEVLSETKLRNNIDAGLKSTSQDDRRNDQRLTSLQVKFGDREMGHA